MPSTHAQGCAITVVLCIDVFPLNVLLLGAYSRAVCLYGGARLPAWLEGTCHCAPCVPCEPVSAYTALLDRRHTPARSPTSNLYRSRTSVRIESDCKCRRVVVVDTTAMTRTVF